MLDLLFNGGEVIGFVAAFLTTIAFIPQVLKVLKTKSVEGLSLTTYLLYISGVFLWFIYGVNYRIAYTMIPRSLCYLV